MDERDEDELAEEIEDLSPLMERYGPHLGGTVDSVVSEIGSSTGVRADAAARDLNRLSEGGLVRFVDDRLPEGIYGYLFSYYSGWFWVVIGFILLTASSIYLFPQVYPFDYLRVGAGAIFTLYVPGYALIEALYPKGEELERLERFALGVGLSLALVPLTGLVLNYTPWGIRLNDTFMALVALSTALSLLAVYRKYRFWGMTMRLQIEAG